MVNLANIATFVAVLFSVIPAMALMYVMLQRYEGFFDEKRLFKFLMMGLVAGAIVTIIELVLLGLHDPSKILATPPLTALLVLGIGYPALEAAAKVAVLNWHSIAGSKDAPYYGTALGLGVGAIATFIIVARGIVALLTGPQAQFLSHFQLITFHLLLFLLFVGGIMAHAASGTIVAGRTAIHEPLRGLFMGTLVVAPFYLGYWAVYSAQGFWSIIIPFAVLGYGFWVVHYAMNKVLDPIVPEDLAKQVRRDRRAMQRGGA